MKRRILIALVIGALTFGALQGADHTLGGSPDRSGATLSAPARAPSAPATHLSGVLVVAAALVAALLWLGAAFDERVELWTPLVTPIRRRGPPSSC